VGTSAAIGVPIALSGAVGYAWHGLGEQGLPGYSVGYVYLPALLGVALVSVCFAPLGAALAHRTPVRRLRRWFAAFLLIVAARMLLAQLRGG
ncbi:MAG TPA: TSUP family transporter, partial [Polyangiaceae bacterium]|nr:TSUP family transporter [Polyangiaceae bacterium]